MNVALAKETARDWVVANYGRQRGFVGAYLAGSINTMAADAAFPACSDVDIFVVLEGVDLPAKRGKFRVAGFILEVNFVDWSEIATPEQILADYHVAGSFRQPNALIDPAGRLAALQMEVGAVVDQPAEVLRRVAHAASRIAGFLEAFERADTLHDRVTCLFFAAGVTTHVLLVAGLKNPTIRRRYAACREVLADHDRLDFHERLLATLGSQGLRPSAVQEHLETAGRAFDLACTVLSSPFEFAQDMSADLRDIAIGGSQEMIDQGLHREAIFWVVAVFARARAVAAQDASQADLATLDQDLEDLLSDLGVATLADMQVRAAQIERDAADAVLLAGEIVAARTDA